jgi:hypothetical protein
MKKKILFTYLVIVYFSVCCVAALQAQITHTIGSTLPFGIRSYSLYGNVKNSDAYYMAMLTYGFRYNISETSNSSFSIGPLISAGGGFYSDGFLYSGDLQAWADYNVGMGAVPDPPKNTGVYFGAGIGGSYTGADGQPIDDGSGISFGPMVRAGFRFGVRDTPIGVGIY